MPDSFERNVAQAVRHSEATIVVTGLVRAGRAVDPRGLRMLGGESLGQLRAEKREGGHAQQGGEMAGSGIVADEPVGSGQDFQQAIQVGERIVDQGDLPARATEVGGEGVEPFPRPLAHGLSGAGVDDQLTAGTRRWWRDFQLPVQLGGQIPPMLGPVGA